MIMTKLNKYHYILAIVILLSILFFNHNKESKFLTIIEGQKVYTMTDSIIVLDMDSSLVKITASSYKLHRQSIQERQEAINTLLSNQVTVLQAVAEVQHSLIESNGIEIEGNRDELFLLEKRVTIAENKHIKLLKQLKGIITKK